MKRYQKKKNRWKNPGILAALAVVLILACVLAVENRRLGKVRAEYQRQEQELRREVEEESQRAEELEEYRIYVQTREYIQQMAREKFGLVNPDETVVKPEN